MGTDEDEALVELITIDTKIEELKKVLAEVMEERAKIMKRLKRPAAQVPTMDEPATKKPKFTLQKPRLILEEPTKPSTSSEMQLNDNTPMDDEDEWNTPKPKKDGHNQYIPPIFIYEKENWLTLANALKGICEGKITAKSGPESIKLKLENVNDFKAASTYLDNHNIEYHTFTLEKSKFFKVVIKGLPTSITDTQVKDELKAQGYEATYTAQLKDRNKKPMPIYQATFKKEERNKEIFKLSTLCYCKVRVESYRKPKEIVQCHRCQRFNHTTNNCKAMPKCVKCAGDHLTKECKKPRDTPAKCANCGENHPANYRGCRFHTIIKERTTTRPPVQQILQTKPRIEAYETSKDKPKQNANSYSRIEAYDTSKANTKQKAGSYAEATKSDKGNNIDKTTIRVKSITESLKNQKSIELISLLKIICQNIIENGD